MLHWPKKSLVMPFYYINFDQNGPPYPIIDSGGAWTEVLVVIYFSTCQFLSLICKELWDHANGELVAVPQ